MICGVTNVWGIYIDGEILGARVNANSQTYLCIKKIILYFFVCFLFLSVLWI